MRLNRSLCLIDILSPSATPVEYYSLTYMEMYILTIYTGRGGRRWGRKAKRSSKLGRLNKETFEIKKSQVFSKKTANTNILTPIH